MYDFGPNPADNPPKFSIDARRGFRMWYAQDDGTLKSVIQNYYWRAGWNHSQCFATVKPENPKACAEKYHPGAPLSHLAQCPAKPKCEYPTLECQCGFYAYHERSHWSPPNPKQINQVVGVIEGIGRLVIGTKGFRAQKALIVGLAVPFAEDKLVERIRAHYPNVPVFRTEAELLDRLPLQGRPKPISPEVEFDG